VKAGFVAIVGQPNVGKSTLFNRVLGEKIAIVSPRPQTTRTRILGVYNGESTQLAFFDTPGLHRATSELNQRMVSVALATLSEVDLVLLLVEAGAGPGNRVEVGESMRWIIDEVARRRKETVLGISKMDRVPRESLLPVIAAYKDLHPWSEVIPFSALTGENVSELLRALTRLSPESAMRLFPEDTLTDQAERQIAAEYVREQVMLNTRAEVPYSAAVLVEEFDESERNRGKRGLVRIGATIVVERQGQKGIMIGKGGALLKEIGTRARGGLEQLLGCKVFLRLNVRVDEHWSDRPQSIRRLGI